MNRQASPRMPKYPSLTQLMTRGTFYDVGYNVGLQFGNSIKRYFAESDNVQGKLLPFYDSREGRDYYEKSLKVSHDCFPQYVREVRGIADGAGLPFEHLFMANVSKEVYNVLYPTWKDAANGPSAKDTTAKGPSAKDTTAKGPSAKDTTAKGPSQKDATKGPSPECTAAEDPEYPHNPDDLDSNSNSQRQQPHPQTTTTTTTTTAPPPSPTTQPFQENYGCSEVFLKRAGHPQYVVHNEDCDPVIKAYGYLLTAQIEEDGEREQFTSFCYPGFLPGCAFSYNVHGLSISINGMYPDHIVEEAPSRLFVNRSLLSARSVDDVVRLAQNEPWGVAYGFCANLSAKDGAMASVEVGPGRPRGLVHVQHVQQAAAAAEGERAAAASESHCYYHFNSYKHLTEVSEVPGLGSSIGRAQRAAELPPPRTLQETLRVMADTHDPLHPIFHTPRPTDLGETVCTAAFDVTARQVYLYQGREDLLTDSPFAKLPMYQ